MYLDFVSAIFDRLTAHFALELPFAKLVSASPLTDFIRNFFIFSSYDLKMVVGWIRV